MTSILADQQRPCIWAQLRGGGGELRGLSQLVQLYTGTHINFVDLIPYDLTPQRQTMLGGD
jgi:hypothetical protein